MQTKEFTAATQYAAQVNALISAFYQLEKLSEGILEGLPDDFGVETHERLVDQMLSLHKTLWLMNKAAALRLAKESENIAGGLPEDPKSSHSDRSDQSEKPSYYSLFKARSPLIIGWPKGRLRDSSLNRAGENT